MKSLHARLVVSILAAITLLLAGAGVLVYQLVEKRMFEELDRSLTGVVQASVRTVNQELEKRARRGPPLEEGGVLFPDPPGGAVFHLQCWFDDGEVLARSESLGAESLPRLAADLGQIVCRDLELPDGSPGRAAGLLLRPPLRPPPLDARPELRDAPPRRQPPPEGKPPLIEVVVARDTIELRSALDYLRWILLLTWAASSLGCAAILSWVVPGSLRPLRRLRDEIRELDEARLDQRFLLPGAPTELVPVVDQLNALIERIAGAFDREQAFTDHAAHELRTPLAGLRSTLEVELSRPRSVEDHRQAAQQCLAITLQMQAMVEGLLDLARLAQPRADVEPETVVLAQLVEECWQPWASEALRRGLSLELDIEPELELRTDRVLLRRVVANLLENAVAHGEEGGSVDLSARLEDGQLTMSVSNPVREAPAELATRAFDAFWRGDASRSGSGRHAGLGLALCKRIVEALGGRAAASCDGACFTVTIELTR